MKNRYPAPLEPRGYPRTAASAQGPENSDPLSDGEVLFGPKRPWEQQLEDFEAMEVARQQRFEQARDAETQMNCALPRTQSKIEIPGRN